MSRGTAQCFGRYLCRGALAVAAAALVGVAAAQDPVEREGYFEVRSASTRLNNGVHSLDARLQLVLSSEALHALNSGVPLTIELQLQMIRSRRFYLDALDAELAVQDSFATLYSALNNLGRIQGLPVIDESLLIPNRDYRVRLRALLATEQYSAPLRLLFFWRDEWQLKSEWYEWSLER